MLVRNSIYLLTERFTNALSSFLTMVIAANLLSITEFGEYTYNTAVFGILAPIVFFGLNGLLVKRLIESGDVASVILNATLVRFIAFLVVAVALVIFAALSSSISLLLLIALFACIFQTFEAYNQAFQRNYITVFVRISVTVTFLVIKLFLLWHGDVEKQGILMVFVGEFFLYFSVGFWVSTKLRVNLSLINLQEIKILVSGSVFLLASGFAEILNLRIDQVMIAEYIGSEAVGQYSVGVRFIEFSVMFAAAIAAAYYPKLAALQRSDAEFYAGIRMINLVMLVLATCFIVVLYFLGPTLISIFFGNGFDEAKIVMLYLLPCVYLLFFRVVISKWIVATGTYWYSLFSHSFGAIVNIILNLLLLPIWGITGAVVASLISYFVACWIALIFHPKTREYLRNAYFA